eukprot:scaffold77516_cov51-Phaeocystis_antarctica.AAC.3
MRACRAHSPALLSTCSGTVSVSSLRSRATESGDGGGTSTWHPNRGLPPGSECAARPEGPARPGDWRVRPRRLRDGASCGAISQEAATAHTPG